MIEKLRNIRLLQTLSRLIIPKEHTAPLGRWNLKHSGDIKGSLANMDCCGDSLCGTPERYTEAVSNILDENQNLGKP